jgi:hypothetical protein
MDRNNFDIEVDRVGREGWIKAFDLFEDANPYQTWSYGAVHWGEGNLSHLVLRNNGEICAIAQLRIVRLPLKLGGIAYLRWGPLCQRRGGELDPDIVKRMMDALVSEYVDNRKLLLRIIPDAFAGRARGEIIEKSLPNAKRPKKGDRTFVLDLTPSLEELRRNLDQKWRNQLNRAEKNNLQVQRGTGPEDYQVFLGLYEAMWRRKKFDTTVNVHEFGRICADLPESQKFQILICRKEGRPVCGIVCSTVGRQGIYLLGATNDDGLDAKGAYLLQWNIISWLKNAGFHSYDLGGIDPELNPGVYHFKRGFSAEDVFRLGVIDVRDGGLGSIAVDAVDFARYVRSQGGRKLKGVKTFMSSWRKKKLQSK